MLFIADPHICMSRLLAKYILLNRQPSFKLSDLNWHTDFDGQVCPKDVRLTESVQTFEGLPAEAKKRSRDDDI